MIRRIAQHTMRSDDGRTYIVDEYQEFIDVGTKDGEDCLPGMKYLQLADGSKVNFVDDDTFKIVRSGTILQRVST